MRTIYGILNFPTPIVCAKEVLGNHYSILVAKQNGFLEFPRFPILTEGDADIQGELLLPPIFAESWKWGDEDTNWGFPIEYPSGKSEVRKIIITFENDSVTVDKEIGNAIFDDFARWLNLFEPYIEIFTKQTLSGDRTIKTLHNRLNLIYFDSNKKSHTANDINIKIKQVVSKHDFSLKHTDIEKICSYCSNDFQPLLEYRILNEANRAFFAKDYRKAVLECSTAVEIVLTKRIQKELSKMGSKFEEGLLKKFRMLSGRFELINLLGIQLPQSQKDYLYYLIEPRNNVIHKASFSSYSDTKKMIEVSEELIKLFSPEIAEE